MKRTGGATLSATLAVGLLRPGIVWGQGAMWESKEEPFKKTVADLNPAAVDALLDNLLKNNQLFPQNAVRPSVAQWKADLNWGAQHAIKIDLEAKLTWEEKAAESGQATKYRKVSWQYDGNYLDNWNQNNPLYAAQAYIAGGSDEDTFVVGNLSITSAVVMAGADQDGGHTVDLSVGEGYKTTFGTVDANNSLQPQSVFTNKETFIVESFDFDHTVAACYCNLIIPCKVNVNGTLETVMVTADVSAGQWVMSYSKPS